MRPPENAELETLFGKPGCGVIVPACVDQREAFSQFLGKPRLVVAIHRQPAALFRAVDREGRDDHVTARRDVPPPISTIVPSCAGRTRSINASESAGLS